MATGPWHYEKAECLLGEAALADDADLQPYLVWAANTHAMLALAAATALGPHEYPTYSRSTDSGWFAAAGPQEDPQGPNLVSVWWLDDGGESPEPDLYATEAAAQKAAVDAWKAGNPFTEITNLEWLYVDSSNGDPHVDTELNINHQYTGHVVRARQPKAGD